MSGRTSEDRPVVLSLRIYQMLLVAYPVGFRRAYGRQMVQLFRDCSLGAYHQRGPAGMTRYWATTLPDVARSVVEEHLQKETIMKVWSESDAAPLGSGPGRTYSGRAKPTF